MKIDLPVESARLLVVACQCAAHISYENGHIEQERSFRALWEAIDRQTKAEEAKADPASVEAVDFVPIQDALDWELQEGQCLRDTLVNYGILKFGVDDLLDKIVISVVGDNFEVRYTEPDCTKVDKC